MTTIVRRSSWIRSVAYRAGFLALFLAREDLHDPPVALLYGSVPSWVPGLLMAGTGRRSVGLAYNRLVKGRYAYQRITGGVQVDKLRRASMTQSRQSRRYRTSTMG
jgi:hypothetical protein